MKEVKIFDTTLRDWAQTAWVNMTKENKIEIAKRLDDFWVDMIEAWFAISSPWDFEAIKTIWEQVSAKVYSLARLNISDINASYEALKDSKNRWLHTFIWTSHMHREYKLKMNESQILEEIAHKVTYARNKFKNDTDAIMFSPEDALRTEEQFLYEAIKTAIKSWANQINIPDTVWFAQVEEISKLMQNLTKEFQSVDFSIHTHNDLWNAVTNSLVAAKYWANIIQWTIPPAYWERAWNADLIQVLMNIIKRPDYYGIKINDKIDMTKVASLVAYISNSIWKRVSDNHPITWSDVFRHSSWIHQDWAHKNKSTYEIISPEELWYKIEHSFILTNQSWRSWLKNAIIWYFWIELAQEKLDNVFDDFKDFTSNLSTTIVTMDVISDILKKNWINLSRSIVVNDYLIYIDYSWWSKSAISLTVNWNKVYWISNGVWPVDAIYNSILKATWMQDISLVDFNIASLSASPSSEAKVSIKVEHNSKIYEEFWVDKDIVKASTKAFVNCLDRIKNA